MNEKEIHNELKHISQKFNDLILDFERLERLSKQEFKKSSLKGGPVNEAVNRACLILKYICKTSNLQVKQESNKNDGHGPVFKDYIDTVFPYSKNPKRIRLEFDNIRKIRNRCIHPDENDPHSEIHEELTQNKLESVKLSLEYVMTWFFKTHLEDKYSQFYTPKVFSENETEPEYIKTNEFAGETTSNTINNNFTDKKSSGKSRKTSFKFIGLFGLLITLVIIFALYNPSVNSNTKNASEAVPDSAKHTEAAFVAAPITDVKAEVCKLLDNFFDKLIDETELTPSEYFAEDVCLKLLTDTTTYDDISPEDALQKCRNEAGNINPAFRFNIENLEAGDELNKWVYTIKLSSFKLNGNSQKRIRIECIVGTDNKISLLKESEIDGPDIGS